MKLIFLPVIYIILCQFLSVTGYSINYDDKFLKQKSHNVPTESVYIALKQENIELLKELFVNVSDPTSQNYGNYMTRDQILQIVSPQTPASIEAKKKVQLWIMSNGGNSIEDLGDAFKFITDRSKLVNFKNFPKYFSTIIDFVHGQSEHITSKVDPRIKPKINKKGISSNVDNGYCGREVIQRVYDMPNTTVATDTSVGSIEYRGQSGFSQPDLILIQKTQFVTPRKAAHVINIRSQYREYV